MSNHAVRNDKNFHPLVVSLRMFLHPNRTLEERIRKLRLGKGPFQNDLPNIIGMSYDYKGVLPFENKTWQRIKPEFRKPSKKHIGIGKSFRNYLWDTCGRIPAAMNTKLTEFS